MDSYEAFRDLQRRWNRGEDIPLFDEDDREYPLEEQLSIQSISGQTSFTRGIPEEFAGPEDMEIENGEY